MRVLFLFFIIIDTFGATAQYRVEPSSKLLVDVNFQTGELFQNISGALPVSYPNAMNTSAGTMKFINGRANVYNISGTYYFDRKGMFGIGTGVNVTMQHSTLGIDSFHVEYAATDYKGSIFRQIISSNDGVSEAIKATNISIPVFVSYKRKIGEGLGIGDALSLVVNTGLLLNAKMQYTYSSGSTFDYEAAYKFDGTGNNLQALYDNSAVPSRTDWLITKSEFAKENPQGNVADYFSSLQARGYSVGLSQSVKKNADNVTFKSASVSYFIQAGVNYNITDRIYGKAGLYYSSQSFINTNAKSDVLIDPATGTYHSLTNYIKDIKNTSYGVSFGIGYYFM